MTTRILVIPLALCLALGFICDHARADTQARGLIQVGDIFHDEPF